MPAYNKLCLTCCKLNLVARSQCDRNYGRLSTCSSDRYFKCSHNWISYDYGFARYEEIWGDLPSNKSFNSRLASLLSRRSCRSISWLMRFCSFASSDKQHSMLDSLLINSRLFCFTYFLTYVKNRFFFVFVRSTFFVYLYLLCI